MATRLGGRAMRVDGAHLRIHSGSEIVKGLVQGNNIKG
jgi:hypothetical protein